MKIRRLKSLLYIFSSVMVLGLALVSFDTMGPKQPASATPSSTPVPKDATVTVPLTNTPTPAPTQNPKHTATPSPTPTSTPTPTLSPTPTPSLAQVNAAIAIRPATDDIGTGLTTVITEHLKDYYSNEALQVKEINNITCHYKEGVADVSYFVYAAYDITYANSNVPVPTLEEYCITIDGETITITKEPENEEVKEALFLSRASQSVSELYIKEFIRCYMNAELACDEELLHSMVVDSDYIDIKKIEMETQYIERYSNFDYIFFKAPDSVTEFDYVVYTTFDVKIININTLAPGMEEYVIVLDDQNYPVRFFGSTSAEADAALVDIRMQEVYQNTRQTIENRLIDAMILDPDLLEFMERIKNATGTAE